MVMIACQERSFVVFLEQAHKSSLVGKEGRAAPGPAPFPATHITLRNKVQVFRKRL
jgi:hypothetical protein